MPILVDSNVILDLVNEDPVWLNWSRQELERYAGMGLTVNPMIYSELCCGAESSDDVDALLGGMGIEVSEIPRQALFLAAKAHLAYRRRGGTRTSGLPDFFIGAHAEVTGMLILTRDKGR